MTTTAYAGIDGHLNFNIPRVKRKLIKDNLTSLDLESRDAKEILASVRHSYLEPNYSGNFSLKSIDVVVNKQLEELYREKKYELKEEGRHSKDLTDQYVYLACKDPNVPVDIAKNGVRAIEKGERILNVLGNSRSGVSLWKHADVQISFAETYPAVTECKILMFKVVLGKCKSIQPSYGSETVIEPTPNYDCHVSSISARIGDPFYPKLMKSQIFFYEYTDEALPSPTPRQCLPHAVLTYSRPAHTAPADRSPLKVAYNNYYKSFKVKADSSSSLNSENNSVSQYGRKEHVGRGLPSQLRCNVPEFDPRESRLPMESHDVFSTRPQGLLPNPYQSSITPMGLPQLLQNTPDVDLRLPQQTTEPILAKKQPLLPNPLSLSVNIESPQFRSTESTHHLPYSAHRKEIPSQNDQGTVYSTQTGFPEAVAPVSTNTVGSNSNSSGCPDLMARSSVAVVLTGASNSQQNELPPHPRLARRDSQNTPLITPVSSITVPGKNISLFTACEFSSSSDNEAPSSLQRNAYLDSPSRPLPNCSYSSVPVTPTLNVTNQPTNTLSPQKLDLNKVQQTVTDSHLEMLKKALSTSQGVSNVPNSPNLSTPASSVFSSPQSISSQSSILSPVGSPTFTGLMQSRQEVRPKAGKLKLSLESYRQKKRLGSALVTQVHDGNKDENIVNNVELITRTSQSEQPLVNTALTEQKPLEAVSQHYSAENVKQPNSVSGEPKLKGILKMSSDAEENKEASQEDVNLEVNTPLPSGSEKLYSPDSPTSTTSSIYSGDTSSVTSSLPGTVSHCPSPVDFKNPVKKKKKVNRNLMGYKKRRKRKGKKPKAIVVAQLAVEPSPGVVDVPESNPVPVSKERVNPLWLLQSPVKDSDIEYNDFSFDFPGLLETAVLNETILDNAHEQSNVPQTLTFSTPFCSLESYGIQHWSQALTDKRFQPKLVLFPVQMDTPEFQQDCSIPVDQVDDPQEETTEAYKDNSQVLQADISSDEDTLVIDIDYGDSSTEFKKDAKEEPSTLSSPTSETKASLDKHVMISSVGLEVETKKEVSSSTILSPESPNPSLPEETVDIDAVIDRDMKEGSNLYTCPEIKLERSNLVNINSKAPERALPMDQNTYKHPVDQNASAANDFEETERCPLTLYSPESPTDDSQLCASDLFSTENSYPLSTVSDKRDLVAVVDIDLNQTENIYKCPQIGHDNNVNQTFPAASITKTTEDHQGSESLTNTADDVTLQAIHQVAVNILPYMKGNSNISIGEISQTIATILSSANQEGSSAEAARMLVADTVEENPMYNQSSQWSEHQNENYGNGRDETVCDIPIRSVDETKVEMELVNTETEIQTVEHISGDVNKPNSELNSQFFIPTLRQQSDALYSAYTSHINEEKTVESAEQTAAKWLGQMAQLCNLPKKLEKPDTTDYLGSVQTSFNIQLPAKNHSNTNWNSVQNDDTKPNTLLSGEDIHSSVMENLEETAFRLSNSSTFSEVNHSKPEENVLSQNTSRLENTVNEFVTTKTSVSPKIYCQQESLKVSYLRSPTDKSNIQVTSNPQNIQKASNELNFNTGSKLVQNEIQSPVGYQGNLIEVPLKPVIHKKKSKKSKRKKKKLASEKTHKSKKSEKVVKNLLSKAQTLGKGLEQPSQIVIVHNKKMEPQILSASQIEHIGEVQLKGAEALVQQQSDMEKVETIRKPITKTLSGQNDILKWFEDMLKPKENLKQMVDLKKGKKSKSEKMKEEVVDRRYCDVQKSMEHDLYKSKESFNDLKKRSMSRERSLSPKRSSGYFKKRSRSTSPGVLHRQSISGERSPRDLRRPDSREKFSQEISRRSRERSLHKSERRSRGRYSLDSGERSSSRGRSRPCSRERSYWISGKRSRSRSKSRLRDGHSHNPRRLSRSSDTSRNGRTSRRSRSRFRSRSGSRHSSGLWKRSRSRERSSTASRKLRARAHSSIGRSRSRSRRSVGLKSRSRSRGRSLRRRSRERLSDRSARSRFSRSLSFSLSPSLKRKRADDSLSRSSFASSSSHRSRSSSKTFRERSRSSSYRKSRGRSSSYSPGHQRRHSRTPSDRRPTYQRYRSSWHHNWRGRSRGNRSSSSSPKRPSRYGRSRSKTLSDREKRKRSLSVKGRETNQSFSRSCSNSRAPLGSPKRDRSRRLEKAPQHQKDNNLDSKPHKSESNSRKMQKYDRQESNKSEQGIEFIAKVPDQNREIRKESRYNFMESRSELNVDKKRESQNHNRRASKESRSEFESTKKDLKERREIKTSRRQSSADLNKTENIGSHYSKRVNPKDNQTQLEQNKLQSDSRQVRVPGCNKLVSSLPLDLKRETDSSKLTTDEMLSEKERIFEEMCCKSPSTAALSGGTQSVKHQRVKELSSVYTKGKVEAKTLDDLASDRARILTELNGLNSDSESVSSHVSLDDKQLLLNSPIHQQAATNEPLFEEALGVILASPNTSRNESSRSSKIDLEDSHILRGKWSNSVPGQASRVEQSGEHDRKKVGAAWGQIVSNIHLEKQERLKGTRVDISSVSPSDQIKEESVNILYPEQSNKSGSDLFEIECQATLAKIQKTKRKTQLEQEQLAQSEAINEWFSVFVGKDCRAFDLLLFRLCKSLGIVSSVKFSELSKKNRKKARKIAEDMSTLVNSILSSSLSKLSLPGLHWPESKGKTLSQWLALGIDSQSPLYKRILFVLCLEVAVPSYQLVASFNTVMGNKLKEYVYFLQELITTLKPPKDLSESANSSIPEAASCKNKKVEKNVSQVLSNTPEESRIIIQAVHPGKLCKSCGRNSDILGVEFMIARLKDIKQLMSRANSFFVEYVKHMKVILWNAKVFNSVRFNLDKVLNLLRSVNSLPSDIKKHIPLLTPASENIAKVLHMTKFLYFKKREVQIRLVISMISNSETLLVQALVQAEAEYTLGYVPKMAKCEDFKSCPECVLYLQDSQSRVQSEEFILLDPSNVNRINTNDNCAQEMQPSTNVEITSKETVPDIILLTFKNMHASLGGGPDDCKWKGTGRFEKIPKHFLLPAEINSGVLYGGRCLYFTRNLRDKVAKQLVRCKQNITRINKCLALAPNPDQETAKVRMLNLRWNLLTRYTTKLSHKKYQELLRNLDKYKLCLEWHKRGGFPEIEMYQTDAISTLIKAYIERIAIAVEVVQDGMARLEAEKTGNSELTGAQISDQSVESESVKIFTPNESNSEVYSSEECSQQKVILWNNCDKAEDSNIKITYFTSDDTVLEPSTSRMVEPRMIEPRIVEPRMVEPRMVEPRMVEPRMVEPRMVEPRMVEPRMIEPRMGDTRQVLSVDPTVDHFENSNRGSGSGYESRQVVYGPGNSDNPHGDVDLRLERPRESYRTVGYPEYRENVDYFPVARTSPLAYNTADTMRDHVQYQENYVHNPDSRGHRGGTTVTALAPSLSLVDGGGNSIHINSRGFDERLSWEPNSPLSEKISTQESFLNKGCFDDSIYKEFNVPPGNRCGITSHLVQETFDQRLARIQSNIIEEFIETKLNNFYVTESKCCTTPVFDCEFQSACEGLVLNMGETYLNNKSGQKNLQNRINPLELNDTNDEHFLRQDEGEEFALQLDENRVTESLLMKTDVDIKDQDICFQITSPFQEKATRPFRGAKDEMSNNTDHNSKKTTLGRKGIFKGKESIYSSISKTPSHPDLEKSYVSKSGRSKQDSSMRGLLTHQKHEVKHFCDSKKSRQTELFEIFSGQPDSHSGENIGPQEQGIIDLNPRKTYGRGEKHMISPKISINHELKLNSNSEIGNAFSDIQANMTSMSEPNAADMAETCCSVDAVVQSTNVKPEECLIPRCLNPTTEIANSKSSSLSISYVNCSKKVFKPECNEGDEIIRTSKWDKKWVTKSNQESNMVQLNYSGLDLDLSEKSYNVANETKTVTQVGFKEPSKHQKETVEIVEKCAYMCSKSKPFNWKLSVIPTYTQVEHNELKGESLVIEYDEKKSNRSERVSREHSNSSGSVNDTILSLIPRETSDNLINEEENSLPHKHIPKLVQKCENVPFGNNPHDAKSTEDCSILLCTNNLSTTDSAVRKDFARENTSATRNPSACKNPSAKEKPSATDDASISKTWKSQIPNKLSQNQCDVSNKESKTDNKASAKARILLEHEKTQTSSRTKTGYITKTMDKCQTPVSKSAARSSSTAEKPKSEMRKISLEKVSNKVPKGRCANTGFQQQQFRSRALFGSKFLMHNNSPKDDFQLKNMNNHLQNCSRLPLCRPPGNRCFATNHQQFSLRLPVNNGSRNARPSPDHNRQNGFSVPDINYRPQGCSRLPVMNKHPQYCNRLPMNNCQQECSRFPTNSSPKDCFSFPRTNPSSFTRFPNPRLNDFQLNDINNCQKVCSRFQPSYCQTKGFRVCSPNPQTSDQFPDNSGNNYFRTPNMNNQQRVCSRFPIINNLNESFRFTRTVSQNTRFSYNHQQNGFR